MKFISAIPMRSLILMKTLLNQPHFTREETEAQRGEMTGPRSNTRQASAPEFNAGLPDPQCHSVSDIPHCWGQPCGPEDRAVSG